MLLMKKSCFSNSKGEVSVNRGAAVVFGLTSTKRKRTVALNVGSKLGKKGKRKRRRRIRIARPALGRPWELFEATAVQRISYGCAAENDVLEFFSTCFSMTLLARTKT